MLGMSVTALTSFPNSHALSIGAGSRVSQTTDLRLAARLSAVLEGLPGGVLILNELGIVVEHNAAASLLLGEPLMEQSFEQALSRAAVDAFVQPGNVELRSGRFLTVGRLNLAGEEELVVLTDITEAHRMQVFLTRQQRLLTMGELAAGLAHQIRTPLATALLYATQMTLPERSSSDLRRCAERAVESLKQLDRLINDMLAFVHGGARREAVNVAALLEQVAQWLRPVLRSGVRLTIRTQAPELKVRANAPSLVSAVLNLATNALQACRADLDIELLARRCGKRAQLIVSDNGPGIPAALQARIFEPFFTTRARGNGIGLSIVKSVIEAHAGTVSLEPSAAGACFLIDLPAEETHDQR